MPENGCVTIKAGPDAGAPWIVIPWDQDTGRVAQRLRDAFDLNVGSDVPVSDLVAMAAKEFQASYALTEAATPGHRPPPRTTGPGVVGAAPGPLTSIFGPYTPPAQTGPPPPPQPVPPGRAAVQAAVSGQSPQAGGAQEATAPVCTVCGTAYTWREGVAKTGKPYRGWFCPTRGCTGEPRWG